MTYHYEITKAINRSQWDRLYPCSDYRRCHMIKLDNGPFIQYNHDAIDQNWGEMSHRTCPQLSERMRKAIERDGLQAGLMVLENLRRNRE